MMKRILLLLSLLLGYSWTFAQVIEKSKRILGGTLEAGFNHSRADTIASSGPAIKATGCSLSVSPSFGKAIQNNLVFGYVLSLSYSHSKSEDLRYNQTGKSNGYGLGAGVFLEKFFPLTKSLSFSGSLPLQLNYSSSQNKVIDNSNLLSTGTNKFYAAGISIYPSLNYLLNKKFLLQLSLNNFVSLGYTYSTNQIKGTNYTGNKQSNSNFGFNTRVNQQTRLSDLGFAFRYMF